MDRLMTPPPPDLDTLSPEAQQRLGEILEKYLVDLESNRRPDLARLMAENPDLASHLRRYAASLDFLQQAAGEMGPAERASAASPPVEQLGDYQILGEIGRGGMGIVYEARQISLDRRVALKVLPLAGLLDPKQIARFQQEAKAAAQLHHPNIVPIYSVGCDRGMHYYAMQYVEGQSLEAAVHDLRETCRRRSEPLTAAAPQPAQARQSTQRLMSTTPLVHNARYYQTVAQLGIQAAEALQHAHDFGVIHRDIKPSNLLLDGQGKLWITDFGLARCHGDANLTVTGDVVGTLRYMSPEQAGGKASLIDQRTDVYSLGITLYEMLTLERAFGENDRASLLRSILEDEPRPLRRLDPAVPLDLETIVLKAIAKSREGRYNTAQELADDLRRFLESKPTLARRPSPVARLGKWAQRHRGLVWAGATVAAVAMVALAVSSVLVFRANLQTKAALARAESHYQQARRVVDRFAARHAEQLANLPGAEPLRRELLTDTLGYYQEFIALAGHDPALLGELASTEFKAAAIHKQLGDLRHAAETYRAARSLFEQLARQEPHELRYPADAALCDNDLGLLLAQQGNSREAEAAYRQAISRQETLLEQYAEHAESSRVRNDLAISHANLAMLEGQTGRPDDAERDYRRAIDLHRDLLERSPGEARYLAHLATTYNNLSYLYAQRDPAKAGEFCRQALELQKKLVEQSPNLPKYQSDLALSYNNLGAMESQAGHLDAARAAYAQAIRLMRGLVRRAPAVLAYRSELAVSLNNLGRAESLSEQRKQAQATFEEARQILVDLVRDDPHELSYRSDLGGVLNNLGMIVEHDNREPEAAKLYAEAVEHQRWAVEHAPSIARFREFLDRQYTNYIRVLRSLNRNDEAARVELDRQKLRPTASATSDATANQPQRKEQP